MLKCKIYTITLPFFCSLQYFWEAFPAGSGPTDRTTYMFTYLDSAPHRPSLHQVMEDYWKLMPK